MEIERYIYRQGQDRGMRMCTCLHVGIKRRIESFKKEVIEGNLYLLLGLVLSKGMYLQCSLLTVKKLLNSELRDLISNLTPCNP